MVDGALRLTYNRMTRSLEHWHYDVFELPDDDAIGLGGLRIQFHNDMDGRVSELVAPLEPEVDAIVFDRQPDRRLRDPEYLSRFVGAYDLAVQRVRVSLRGTALELEVPGQPRYTLAPKGDTTFALEGLAGYSVTFLEEEGRVSAARFNQPDGVYTATRVEED